MFLSRITTKHVKCKCKVGVKGKIMFFNTFNILYQGIKHLSIQLSCDIMRDNIFLDWDFYFFPLFKV